MLLPKREGFVFSRKVKTVALSLEAGGVVVDEKGTLTPKEVKLTI